MDEVDEDDLAVCQSQDLVDEIEHLEKRLAEAKARYNSSKFPAKVPPSNGTNTPNPYSTSHASDIS